MNASQPLSSQQKAALSILAQLAYRIALTRQAIDDSTKLDDYRREGQMLACGVSSLKDAKQSHYLYIRGHWHTIIGNAELAFDDFLRAGDDQEARRQMWYRLAGQVARLADGIAHTKRADEITPEQAAAEAWTYAAAICRDKYAGRKFEALDAAELAKLGFTIFNRGSTMLDVGNAENRNKGQRSGKYRRPAGESLMQAARTRLARPVQDDCKAPAKRQ